MSNYENESLGPCGCTDYHMADCGLMGGYARDYYAEAESAYYDEVDFY